MNQHSTVVSTVQWLDRDFYVYPLTGTNWSNIGGIYIFAAQNYDGAWYPIYIGQTDSFRNRVPGHDRGDEAVLKGATAIHAHAVTDPRERADLERRLIEYYQPVLNLQYR